MLPVGGIIVGVIALLLGGYAAITLSKVNRSIAELEAKTGKIEAVEGTANTAAAAAERATRELGSLRTQTQAGFDQVGPIIGNLQASVTKLEESMKKPVVAEKAGKKNGEPAVAGPNEYVVKPGDNGTKIAKATGASLKDIEAVNPGLNWTKIGAGQKLKLPAKK